MDPNQVPPQQPPQQPQYPQQPPQYPSQPQYPPQPSQPYPPQYGSQPYPPQYQQPYQGQPPFGTPGATPDIQAIIKSFTLPDWLIVGGSAVAFIASFLPWYSWSYTLKFLTVTTESGSVNGWNYWASVIAILVGLAVLALRAARAFNISIPILPAQERLAYIGGGAAMVLFSLLTLTQFSHFDSAYTSVSSGPSIAFFLLIAAGIAVAIGGYLKPQQ
jgi:hypothetical protein